MSRPLKEIEKEFLKLNRTIPKGQSKAPLAKLIIEARLEHFTRPDGEPDFQGRSMSFRRWYGELIDQLHLPRDERERFLSAMRYSNGNEIRKVLTPEQMELAGLQKDGPRERGQQSYNRVAASHLLQRKKAITDPEDQLLAKRIIMNLLLSIPVKDRNDILHVVNEELTPFKKDK